jgi:dihydroceramidase
MTQLILSLPPTSVHPARRIITRLFFTGLAIFVSGFLIWNVDNIFCTELRKMKEVLLSYGGVVGKVAWLLEGHAWWHLATGYGAYLIITGSTCKWTNSDYPSIKQESDSPAYRPLPCQEDQHLILGRSWQVLPLRR